MWCVDSLDIVLFVVCNGFLRLQYVVLVILPNPPGNEGVGICKCGVGGAARSSSPHRITGSECMNEVRKLASVVCCREMKRIDEEKGVVDDSNASMLTQSLELRNLT